MGGFGPHIRCSVWRGNIHVRMLFEKQKRVGTLLDEFSSLHIAPKKWQLQVASSKMKRITIILVVCVASSMGMTVKDDAKPTPNPTASAEDLTQEIERLR